MPSAGSLIVRNLPASSHCCQDSQLSIRYPHSTSLKQQRITKITAQQWQSWSRRHVERAGQSVRPLRFGLHTSRDYLSGCSQSQSTGRGSVQAFNGGGNADKAGDAYDGWDASLEMAVPADQRPVNELAALKEAALYSWAQLSPEAFWVRLGLLWAAFFLVLGGPIAAASFEPAKMPVQFVLAGGAGAFFAVAILVLRMYLGWSYVGDRLLSAVVPYEETGWYDGQLWVKPPEVLARDRLLGAYQVKPVMARLKSALLGSASLLAASAIALVLVAPPPADEGFVYVPKRSNSAMASEAVRVRDLTRPPVEVQDDDDLAKAAAQAADGRPVYCRDRFYRALAGGQYCRWSDLQK